MKKFLKIGCALFLVLFIVGAVGLYFVYRATQHEPEFYVEALEVETKELVVAADQLEKNVLDLRNEVRQEGRWEARFTDVQINGWLASELPKEYRNGVPREIMDPRVSFERDLAQVAFRLQTERFSSVISMGVSAQLGNKQNQVAVRIRSLHAGALPLPQVEDWKQKIAQAAIKSGVPFKWETIEGDHVAVVDLPEHHKQFPGQKLLLDTVQVRDGEIYFAGRTVEAESGESNEVLQTADSSIESNEAVQR